MTSADVQLLLSLIEIAQKATNAIKAIKADKPEVYAEVGKHHSDALARLEAASEG
jgi:hypothetical protein